MIAQKKLTDYQNKLPPEIEAINKELSRLMCKNTKTIIEQEPLGYPCSLLVWNENGYHRCAARPIFDKGKIAVFCACYYTSEMGDGDYEGYKLREEKAQFHCAKKYTWKQMEAKVKPSMDHAFKIREAKKEAPSQ